MDPVSLSGLSPVTLASSRIHTGCPSTAAAAGDPREDNPDATTLRPPGRHPAGRTSPSSAAGRALALGIEDTLSE